MKSSNTSKILFLGPRFNKNDTQRVGGAVVLFENILKYCQINQIEILIIDTNKRNYLNPLLAYCSIIWQLVRQQKHCNHISLHSSRDYIFLGLAIIIIGKLFGKTISLRKFGGNAEATYSASNAMKKKLLYFIFSKMDVLFFEMKHLVAFFTSINPNTFWFPNVRWREFTPNLPRTFNKRFVFISHIKHTKGIDEILEVSNHLDESYTIDIYGPIREEKYTDEYFKNYRANYKKPLESNEVLTTLNNYDVLLLPSYKEGYPGIIIEAYSIGIPIISTTLPGLLEITDQYQTGLLIEPKNTDELLHAISYYNELNYPSMADAAYKKFDYFDSNIQTKRFLNILKKGSAHELHC
jgi:glycosyltransferase involved in cell wall biosynthesis